MRAALTLEGTLVGGKVLVEGQLAAYRQLEEGPGEPRVLRKDLASAARPPVTGRRSLVHLAQVSDLQLADVQSPGRFEFFERLRGLPGTGSFVPAQRPQEAMLVHALGSVLETLGSCTSAETGAPVDLVVATGDNLDNAQWNELSWYISVMAGGVVDLGAGMPYGGVQGADWPSDLFWKPDGGGDRWRVDFGFPTIEGVLERALSKLDAPGLAMPWVSCYGNHDGLAFGESIPTYEYRDALLGGEKPCALPPDFDPFEREEELFERPELFLKGPARPVRADADRRVVGRKEFVEAHMAAPGLPRGHGYSWANVEAGTTYFSYAASPLVNLIVLDTANLDGYHEGSIGAKQLAWLECELLGCHSRCLSADGREMRPGGEDRLVVLASHHGSRKLSNLRQSAVGFEDDHPRYGRDVLEHLLSRFPNVVLWLNGHTHVNEIALHRSAAGGYAEVTTCSVADWPSQARSVEIVSNGDGSLSILTTMVNHLAPVVPNHALSDGDPLALASLHRELAANVPLGGLGSSLEGLPPDRNCDILLQSPFPLG